MIEPILYFVSAVRRFLFGPVDLAVAEGAAVKNVAVFGESQAAHPLVLFEEPVKKLVEFRFVQRLRVACGKQRSVRKAANSILVFISDLSSALYKARLVIKPRSSRCQVLCIGK